MVNEVVGFKHLVICLHRNMLLYFSHVCTELTNCLSSNNTLDIWLTAVSQSRGGRNLIQINVHIIKFWIVVHK